jgi:hypothetical protein
MIGYALAIGMTSNRGLSRNVLVMLARMSRILMQNQWIQEHHQTHLVIQIILLSVSMPDIDCRLGNMMYQTKNSTNC